MSSPADAPAVEANPDAGLSKAEIRRRKILAKRGARMALVTGDRTLAAVDVTPAVAPTTPAQPSLPPVPAARPTPAETAAPPAPAARLNPSVDLAALFEGMGAPPSARRAAIVVPPVARTVLVVICALLVPVLRSSVAPRASALQLFLAAEAVVLAPALAGGVFNGGGRGLLGFLNAAAVVSGAMRAVYRDGALFTLALFGGLRVAEKLL